MSLPSAEIRAGGRLELESILSHCVIHDLKCSCQFNSFLSVTESTRASGESLAGHSCSLSTISQEQQAASFRRPINCTKCLLYVLKSAFWLLFSALSSLASLHALGITASCLVSPVAMVSHRFDCLGCQGVLCFLWPTNAGNLRDLSPLWPFGCCQAVPTYIVL